MVAMASRGRRPGQLTKDLEGNVNPGLLADDYRHAPTICTHDHIRLDRLSGLKHNMRRLREIDTNHLGAQFDIDTQPHGFIQQDAMIVGSMDHAIRVSWSSRYCKWQ
jgi:hypothetical protein